MESFSVPMPTVRCIPFTGWWRFRNGPKGRSEGASLLRKFYQIRTNMERPRVGGSIGRGRVAGAQKTARVPQHADVGLLGQANRQHVFLIAHIVHFRLKSIPSLDQ